MAVAKVARKKPRVAKPKVAKEKRLSVKKGKKTKKAKMVTPSKTKRAYPALPTEKKSVAVGVLDCTLLLYGREKIGKTKWFASFPDALFITTEPGTKGEHIFEYNSDNGGCKDWDLIRAAVDLLEKSDDFKCVIVDTVDQAYEMCLDWVCTNKGIEYPGQDEYGREDYGKSWKAVKKEFGTMVRRILQTGRGLGFTSHSKEAEVKTKSGDRYLRIFPSMSNQARVVVEALVDMFFYVDYIRAPDGSTKRVIVTEGNEVVWAGAREIGQPLPRFLPMTKKGGFEILEAAFEGEDVGLDPKTLLPIRTAHPAVKKFYQLVQKEEARKGSFKKKPVKKSKEVKRAKVARRKK